MTKTHPLAITRTRCTMIDRRPSNTTATVQTQCQTIQPKYRLCQRPFLSVNAHSFLFCSARIIILSTTNKSFLKSCVSVAIFHSCAPLLLPSVPTTHYAHIYATNCPHDHTRPICGNKSNKTLSGSACSFLLLLQRGGRDLEAPITGIIPTLTIPSCQTFFIMYMKVPWTVSVPVASLFFS